MRLADENRPGASNLNEWWRLVVARRWIILTGIAIGVAVAGLHSLVAVPQYRAAAILQISPPGSRPPDRDDDCATPCRANPHRT